MRDYKCTILVEFPRKIARTKLQKIIKKNYRRENKETKKAGSKEICYVALGKADPCQGELHVPFGLMEVLATVIILFIRSH